MQRNQDKDFDRFFKDTFADAEITPSENLWDSIEQALAPETNLDAIFKNTFEDAEVEPSINLWTAIEAEIIPAKKRKLPVYWWAAAVVLLVTSIGVLINREQNVAKPAIELAKEIETVKPVPQKDTVAIPVVKNVKDELLAVKPKLNLKDNAVRKNEQKIQPNNPVHIIEKQTSVAQVIPQNVDSTINVIASNTLPKANKQMQNDIIDVINTVPQVTDEPINENDQSNKGIRNFGDLVNLVVNKVDKRKDKLIQFKTDDEDDSSIASINIGPFRFGKKK